MKTKLLILGLSVAGFISIKGQETNTCEFLKVTNGFNADVFVEGLPVESHLTKGIENSTTGFYTTNVSLVGMTTGLPFDMPIKSAQDVIYNIDYTNDNALELTSVNSGELELKSPISTNKLYFLGFKADGNPTTADVEVVVTYSDGETTTSTITYRDWVGTGGTAFNGLKLYDVNNLSVNSSFNIRLDEPTITCDANKQITKIKFTNKTLSGTHPLIMGISTGSTPVEISNGFNKDAVAEGSADPTFSSGIGNTSLILLAEKSTTSTGGLPATQPMKSLQGNLYDIDYKSNNALILEKENDGTLTLANPVKTSKLYCLGFKADGSSTTSDLDVLVTYSDGSTDAGTIKYRDWVGDGGTAFDKLKIIGASNGYITTRNSQYNIRIDEPSVTCNPDKEIVSVTFTNKTLSGTHPVIFALSTGTEAIKISDGLNADVIAEAGNTGASYTSTIGDAPFIIYADGTGGLPADGKIQTASGAKYEINYADLNTLSLGNGTASGTLDIDGSPKAKKIYVLGTCSGGSKDVGYAINYADGTKTNGTIKINDWVYSKPVINDVATPYYGLDRFANGSPEFNYRLGLYENEIAADPTKAVTSITFTCSSNTALIMGLSMQRASDDAVNGQDVTIDESKYSSLYYGTKNLIVPNDVMAYTYKVVNNTLVESKVYAAGTTIPAGEAVVIKGLPGDYTFAYNDTPANTDVKDANSMLYGFDSDKETVAPTTGTSYKFYMVSLNGANDLGSAGFYYCAANGAAFISEAHKVYLAAPAEMSVNQSYMFSEATGIKEISADINKQNVIYTISGIRVNENNMQKGIYIVNGKKVVK